MRSDAPPCLIENEVFWHTPCAETPKTEFLRFLCTETPVLELFYEVSIAQRYSSVPYRERGFWRTPFAETPKTEFLRIPRAIIPLLDDMWRGRRRSISGSLIKLTSQQAKRGLPSLVYNTNALILCDSIDGFGYAEYASTNLERLFPLFWWWPSTMSLILVLTLFFQYSGYID